MELIICLCINNRPNPILLISHPGPESQSDPS
uniref:Uncharacterized protein n=1 Tax=Anguilla anguilla TaxID=7936 RepID=A0A0E9WCH2_ANGAN